MAKFWEGFLVEVGQPNGKNLTVPKGAKVGFDTRGNLQRVQIFDGIPAPFLGFTVTNATFAYDQWSGIYKIASGKLGQARIVATITPTYDAYGNATSFIPLIAPAGSDFILPIDDDGGANGDLEYWRMEGEILV